MVPGGMNHASPSGNQTDHGKKFINKLLDLVESLLSRAEAVIAVTSY